jgi:uncharacterized protein (DUF2336 family)
LAKSRTRLFLRATLRTLTPVMNAAEDLIEQLEDAIAVGDVGHRAEILRRVTDLFEAGAEGFDGEQVALFDDVIGRLIDDVEVAARALVAERLAGIANAPPMIVRVLALDKSIEVAGPLLARSERVDDETLVISARTRTQEHLVAIACRRDLSEAVTDVLVERGNEQVTVRVAQNPGARFSEYGYTTLVERAGDNEELALRVWLRPDIPRQHQLKLFVAASGAVQRRLEGADRRKASLFHEMVANARDDIQAQTRQRSSDYIGARAMVQSMHHTGDLTEAALAGFAGAHQFDQTAVALSLMCDLPIALVERVLVQDRPEMILVLGKAIGLTWETTRAILQVQADAGNAPRHDFEPCCASFARLQPETARKAIHFYRMREQTTKLPARSD